MTQLTDLIVPLMQKTRSAKVKWESLGTTSFVTTLGSYAFVIQTNKSGYSLILTNSSGDTLEQLTQKSFEDYHDELEDIYNTARRSAFDIDKALASVKGLLDGLE